MLCIQIFIFLTALYITKKQEIPEIRRREKRKNYEYNGIKVYRFTHYDLPSDMWPGSNTWLSLRAMDKCLKYLGIAYNDIAVVHAHVSNNARFANHVKCQNAECLTCCSITGMMCWGCHWVGSARRNGTGREHYVME